MDSIIAAAGVAKMTFYRHLPPKDDLVLAFLERREQLWALDWPEAQVTNRSAAPDQRLLAVFEVFNEWFQRKDFEGCSFINVLLETAEPGHPVGKRVPRTWPESEISCDAWPRMQGFPSLMTSLTSGT